MEVEKFAFFAKGLVHDFGQKFEVSLPSLSSAKLIKKNVWQFFGYKKGFSRLKKNIDIRKLKFSFFKKELVHNFRKKKLKSFLTLFF